MNTKHWFWCAIGIALLAILLGCAWIQQSPNVLDSAATSTLVGAALGAGGALFGAWLTHAQAERTKQRESLATEIRYTNAAINIATNSAQAFMLCKKQHIMKMVEAHKKNKAQVIAALNTTNSVGNNVLHLKQDFELIQPLRLSLDMLPTLMVDRLSGFGRHFQAALEMRAFGKLLDESIAERNTLIMEFRTQGSPDEERTRRIYGIPIGRERDGRYDGTMACLEEYADTAIFFAVLCCEDLMKHGSRLADKAVQEFGGIRPHVSRVIFDKPRADGLIPPDDQYVNWLQGHVQVPSAS